MRVWTLTSNSRPWRSIGSFMYIGSAGPGPGGRTDGGRTDGRAGGWVGGRDDFERQYNDFHRVSKTNTKKLCFSVVSRPAEAQVPIFTAQMKKASKKCQKSIVFFDFSNHAGARVPIFTPKMKNFRFARLARLSTRKWDFRRRSRPRELAQRSQDDVSLNKLPQISSYRVIWTHFRPNFIFFGWKISDPKKSKLFLKCKSPHLAILINIWHIWEDRSRKVNNDEPDLRFFHGNFWPVISQAVRKPCPEGWLWVLPFP